MRRKWWRKFGRRVVLNILFVSFVAILLFGTFLIFQMIPATLFGKKLFVSPLPMEKSKSRLDEVKQVLRDNNVDFSSVVIASEASFLVVLRGGEDVLLSQKKDLSNQASSLQQIITRLTIEGRRFTFLDFRFDKPVIVFQ